MIVIYMFDLSYAVSSLITFSYAPWIGHLFGYLKKYPKIGYEINLQPLTIDAYYEKF